MSARAIALACWLGATGFTVVGEAPPKPASPAPVSPPQAALEKPKAFRIERWDWTASAELSAAVRRLNVHNDYGDVRARLAGDGLIGVHAVLQRLGSDPDVGVNVERHGDALALSVVSPPGRVSVSSPQLSKSAVDRVDLVVYVPRDCALWAESLRGLLEVRGLEADVSLATLDGEIRASSTAGLRASSAAGAITALLGGESRAPVLIESRSGAVRLTLPATGDYRLQVETSGALESELPLASPEPALRPGTRRSATLQVGQGSRPIIVRSESGAVALVRR